jgi:hypothetical protein
LTHSSSKPGASLRPQIAVSRTYSPRVAGGKVMTPAELRLLHKYILEIDKVSAISNEMREVIDDEWPELMHKLPPAKPRSSNSSPTPQASRQVAA